MAKNREIEGYLKVNCTAELEHGFDYCGEERRGEEGDELIKGRRKDDKSVCGVSVRRARQSESVPLVLFIGPLLPYY